MLRDFLRFIARSKLGMFGMILFAACVLVAVFAPILAPYEPMQKHYDASGKLMKLRPPSPEHLLGTTILGRDVFSQLLWGGRPALVIGLLTARQLVDAGAQVTLVEMGETGREASWAGGGILSPLYPWRYAESVTALVAWSQQDYPKLCLQLHDETGIDPELTHNGMLILDTEERDLASRWADAHTVHLEVLNGEAVREIEPDLGPGLVVVPLGPLRRVHGEQLRRVEVLAPTAQLSVAVEP